MSFRRLLWNRFKYNVFEKDQHLYHPEYPLNVYSSTCLLCNVIGVFLGSYYSIDITETEIYFTPRIFLGYLLYGMVIGAWSPITIPFLTIKTIYDEYKIYE